MKRKQIEAELHIANVGDEPPAPLNFDLGLPPADDDMTRHYHRSGIFTEYDTDQPEEPISEEKE